MSAIGDAKFTHGRKETDSLGEIGATNSLTGVAPLQHKKKSQKKIENPSPTMSERGGRECRAGRAMSNTACRAQLHSNLSQIPMREWY